MFLLLLSVTLDDLPPPTLPRVDSEMTKYRHIKFRDSDSKEYTFYSYYYYICIKYLNTFKFVYICFVFLSTFIFIIIDVKDEEWNVHGSVPWTLYN